ncbi:hypothetical protein FHR99_001920 [Litorivivens lipolytica]|uniref:Lipoprotein n=1 Tax=Litorivivens lipolytica TaxID=1524264 RepID=A0A7W4W695_9GAMM|nr:hypothetical protein [Litorivivens lipolytica]MBB3047654.1 hypothetical protein [Litorivivens lipolytica]
MTTRGFSLFALLLTALLAGCASQPQQSLALRTEYCDTYLIYDMCVRDIDADGAVDLMYFADTREIFMLSESAEPELAGENLDVHRCLQTLGDALRDTSSQLLRPDIGFLARSRVRSAMLISYTAYLPAINACMDKQRVAASGAAAFADDDFGEDDFF